MDAQQISIAESCLTAAYDKTLSFPEIVETLRRAGFEGYCVDYRCSTTTYYLPDGDSVTLENQPCAAKVAAVFDQPAVASQIKWAQSNPADYSYKAFSQNVKASGCAGYIVSLVGKRVLYFGRTAETHVEHFPN